MSITNLPLNNVTNADAMPNAELSVYERIRNDILAGRLEADARLKISELAKQHGTSTNPVREALQQLRGEGLVLITPNQGARVRTIGVDFVRDVFEIGLQIEPYLVKWFVETVDARDIEQLEDIQRQIVELNFSDQSEHSKLNDKFHQLMYGRHYNRLAVDLWRQHREVLAAISSRITISLNRRAAILQEHEKLIECIKAQDAEKAAKVLRAHIEDAGQHLLEQLRVEQLRKTANSF